MADKMIEILESPAMQTYIRTHGVVDAMYFQLAREKLYITGDKYFDGLKIVTRHYARCCVLDSIKKTIEEDYCGNGSTYQIRLNAAYELVAMWPTNTVDIAGGFEDAN